MPMCINKMFFFYLSLFLMVMIIRKIRMSASFSISSYLYSFRMFIDSSINSNLWEFYFKHLKLTLNKYTRYQLRKWFILCRNSRTSGIHAYSSINTHNYNVNVKMHLPLYKAIVNTKLPLISQKWMGNGLMNGWTLAGSYQCQCELFCCNSNCISYFLDNVLDKVGQCRIVDHE